MWVIIVLLFGFVCAGDHNDDLRRIDAIWDEPECLSAGGMCTVAADCPDQRLARRGLCPKQQKEDIECCHGTSEKETRCRMRGGECMNKCNQNLIAKEATDCDSNSVCCILV